MNFNKSHPRATVAVFLLFLSAVHLPIFWMEVQAYFQTTLLLEFVFGMAIYVIILNKYRISPAAGGLMLLLSAIGFAFNYKVVSAERALAWGLPAALLVLGVYAFEQRAWLRSRIFILLGNASYAIYLTHLTVQIYVGEAALWNGIDLKSNYLLKVLAYFVPSIIVGVVVHLLVERPMLDYMRTRFLPRKRSQVPVFDSDQPVANERLLDRSKF